MKKINKYIFLGFFLILLFHLPLLIYGENSYIITNDILDLVLPNLKALILNNELFSLNFFKVIENVIGGIPLMYFDTPFLLTKIFFLNNIFHGYVLNSVFIRTVGFIGIMRLGLNHFKLQPRIIFLASLSFAFIPVYPVFALTILGLPFLLNSFLNISNNKASLFDFLYIIVFPFLSVFYLATPFIIVFFLLWFYYNNLINLRYLVWKFIFIIFSIISISPQLYSFLLNSNNRGDRFFEATPSFSGGIFLAVKTFIFGELTSSLFISAPILFYLFFFVRKFNKEVRKKIFFLLIVLTAFSLFYSFYPSISNFISSYFSAFSAFNFMRFIFLNTFIFYLIILFIAQKPNIYLKIVLISLIVLNSLRCMDFYYNTFGRFLDKKDYDIIYSEDFYLKKILGKDNYLKLNTTGLLTFKEYYSEDLFKDIKSFINENDFVIHLGINPGISVFNGLKSFDGYFTFYPSEKNIIINKVNKSNLNSKNLIQIKPNGKDINCYNCFGQNLNSYKDLNLSFSTLKNNCVTHLISAFQIDDNNLKFVKTFENLNSPYKIYLYKIK